MPDKVMILQISFLEITAIMAFESVRKKALKTGGKM